MNEPSACTAGVFPAPGRRTDVFDSVAESVRYYNSKAPVRRVFIIRAHGRAHTASVLSRPLNTKIPPEHAPPGRTTWNYARETDGRLSYETNDGVVEIRSFGSLARGDFGREIDRWEDNHLERVTP